ncbi:MAG TPA: hypothetical protein VFZ76_16635, partial [Anaerolineales bacterium]
MKRSWLIPAIILALVLCCLGLFVLGAGGGLIYFLRAMPDRTGEPSVFSSPTNTPRVVRPTAQATSQPGGQQMEVAISDETLRALENTIVPINDLADLARRLEGKDDVPQTLSSSETSLSVGEQDSFW